MSTVQDSPSTLPSIVQEALTSHLPHSLPLYRRLQFTSFPSGSSPSTHILSLFHSPTLFTCAYIDLSRHPETEIWIYSSLERLPSPSPSEQLAHETQIRAILRKVGDITKTYDELNERAEKGVVLVGTCHERVVRVFEKFGVVRECTPPNSKFLFDVNELPPVKELPTEMEWGKVERGDIGLILSRTHIDRRERTLMLLPSAKVTLHGKTIAWSFLAPDASLCSLHCEEEYRGRGLAKAISQKLFRENTADFGPETIQHADVLEGNVNSERVCKSLGGKIVWKVHWVWIDVSAIGEED